jgi:hypothetical protein
LGALDTRKWLNKFYLELSHWKDFNSNKEAHIGDMYIYDDTYNHSTEYFGLIRLDSPSMRYWYFPANKEHTFYWAYLGEDPQLARNKLDMIVSMNLWGQNDRKGQAGDIFVYVNFYTNKIEMFTLNAACTGDRKYWFFPIDASNNDCWSYDGLFSDYVKNKKSKPKQPQLKLKPMRILV